MKYLNTYGKFTDSHYKLFELTSGRAYNIKHDIEDILSEINDMGYKVNVYSSNIGELRGARIEINIFNNSHPEEFTQDNLQEITETIERLYDYMRNNGEFGNVPDSVWLVSYDLPPYNTSGKRRLVGWASIDGRYSDFSWVNLTAKFNKIEIIYRR